MAQLRVHINKHQYLKTLYTFHQMQSTSSSLKRPMLANPASVEPPASKPLPLLDLQAKAAEAAALLKALAHPDRLMLLCQLVGGERSVTELGVSVGMGQPSLSQQLGVLRGERLVLTRREGKQMVYRIASPAALAVLQTLYGLFCEPQPAVSVARPDHAPGQPAVKLRTDAS